MAKMPCKLLSGRVYYFSTEYGDFSELGGDIMDFEFKENYNIDDLLRIMEILRSENGCPWDRVQNHKSIRSNMLEEAYEVCEAIDNEDAELLKEELGDVLLQVVFHARIEEEKGSFDFSDAADGICKKLIVRHPHVFGDVKADTAEEVLKNWDDIKMKTKAQTKPSEAMDSVARTLPALMRADKIRSKAKKAGYISDSFETAYKEAEERLKALSDVPKDKGEAERKIGGLLFLIVRLAATVGADPEESLYHACDAYIESIKKLEKSEA